MTDDSSASGARPSAKIDATVPNSARIWNYWLGGKDNYAVDRVAGEEYLKVFPGIVDVARHSRAFLARAVTYLAGEAQVRQFLDIGTGLPTFDNTHEVAQRQAPTSRIVYVDHDPLVLAHARALLTSTPEGATDYIDADLHEPDTILRAAAQTLDFSQPIALMLMGILGHITDDTQAYAIVNRLLDALPAGSYLVIADGTDIISDALEEAQRTYDDTGAAPYRLRGPDQIARFFEGLELVEPGVVSCLRWRPDTSPIPQADVQPLGGVGRT